MKNLRTIVSAASMLCALASPGLAEIRALVIGIDRYENITPLAGAVNDAVDIATAIAGLDPAEVIVRLDQEATRAEILSQWQRLIRTSNPGDTIIVTFAGHGSSEEAADPSTEEDGRDENFLLAGFAPTGDAAGERIRDDEIAALLALRSDIQHIIVADSCHSGTATRSSVFDRGYRFYKHGELADDPLPPPPPVPAAAPDTSSDIFFAAVGDDELAPEIMIEGKARGALSYSFAGGLRGEADHDMDGVITKGELEAHVRRSVKTILAGRQKPRVSPPGFRDLELLALKQEPEPTAQPFEKKFHELPSVPLLFTAPPPTLSTDLISGAAASRTPETNGLVVDFSTREIRNGSGDVTRKLTVELGYDWRAQIQNAVTKHRFLNALAESGTASEIDISFPFGDALYFNDDPIDVLITGRTTPYVTVINLTSDGGIQWLYPRYAPLDNSGSFNDPPTLDPSQALEFNAYVSPPFGAEHILVIETDEPHDPVRRAAMRYDGLETIDRLWEELHAALKDVPHRIAVHAFFTKEDP